MRLRVPRTQERGPGAFYSNTARRQRLREKRGGSPCPLHGRLPLGAPAVRAMAGWAADTGASDDIVNANDSEEILTIKALSVIQALFYTCAPEHFLPSTELTWLLPTGPPIWKCARSLKPGTCFRWDETPNMPPLERNPGGEGLFHPNWQEPGRLSPPPQQQGWGGGEAGHGLQQQQESPTSNDSKRRQDPPISQMPTGSAIEVFRLDGKWKWLPASGLVAAKLTCEKGDGNWKGNQSKTMLDGLALEPGHPGPNTLNMPPVTRNPPLKNPVAENPQTTKASGKTRPPEEQPVPPWERTIGANGVWSGPEVTDVSEAGAQAVLADMQLPRLRLLLQRVLLLWWQESLRVRLRGTRSSGGGEGLLHPDGQGPGRLRCCGGGGEAGYEPTRAVIEEPGCPGYGRPGSCVVLPGGEKVDWMCECRPPVCDVPWKVRCPDHDVFTSTIFIRGGRRRDGGDLWIRGTRGGDLRWRDHAFQALDPRVWRCAVCSSLLPVRRPSPPPPSALRPALRPTWGEEVAEEEKGEDEHQTGENVPERTFLSPTSDGSKGKNTGGKGRPGHTTRMDTVTR